MVPRNRVFLLDSHEAFLRRSAWLLDGIRHVAPDGEAGPRKRRRWLTRLSIEFDWWVRGMRGHERYEENKLYPFLAERFGASFETLEAAHRMLDARAEAIHLAFTTAVAAVDTTAEPAAHAALVDALESHGRALATHLRSEEGLVIPLLRALPPEELERY